MMHTILDYFEKTERKFGDKKAFVDEKNSITYAQLGSLGRNIASEILKQVEKRNQPIVIFLSKSIESIQALLACVYSGNLYVMMDIDTPKERQEKIFDNLKPAMIITNQECQNKLIKVNVLLFDIEQMITVQEDKTLLEKRRKEQLSCDPLYVLYTSGSTGTPKGVVVSHSNVIAYIKWVIEAFRIDEKTVFGNQTPFYFSMSVLDIFATLFSGATLYIIPRTLFSFPLKLIEFLNEKCINTIYWVPTALNMVANTKTLDYIEIKSLKKILFAGEVMHVKGLNYWKKHVTSALYANLYGPTEVTDICSYYIVEKTFRDDQKLPIGYPCKGCELIILDESGKEVTGNQQGELCVKGPFVAQGYYNNEKKTKEVFIQNPANVHYLDIIYKTGDLVKRDENGLLIYQGRQDYQIKHMGYRIELGEIESAVQSIETIEANVCIYDESKDKLILIYQSKLDKASVREQLKQKVPKYMQPSKYIAMQKIPLNANGKIDRKWVKEHYKTLE